MLRMTTLIAAAAMLASPAEAGVVYTWQQVKASDTMQTGLHLELVFSDKAVASGSVSLDFRNDCYGGPPCYHPQDSLLSLRYWYEQRMWDGSVQEFNLIQFGHRDQPRFWGDHIQMNIAFLTGGTLSGGILANDGNTDFLMQSDGNLFELLRTSSDEGNPCGTEYPDICGGESGLLLATDVVREVPEPSGVLLTGLGLLAAWFARRRRR